MKLVIPLIFLAIGALHFAHFHDPDGNEVTIWEGKQ
jgi:hypothetical protein